MEKGQDTGPKGELTLLNAGGAEKGVEGSKSHCKGCLKLLNSDFPPPLAHKYSRI